MKLKEFLEKYKLQVIAVVVLLAGVAWLNNDGCNDLTAVIADSTNVETTTGTTTIETGATTGTTIDNDESTTTTPETTTPKSFDNTNVIDEAPAKVPATGSDTPASDKTSMDRVECPEDKSGVKPAGYPDNLDNFGC